MGEPRFADDDDLPRTLRRERDAREREMREREMPPATPDEAPYAHSAAFAGQPYGYDYAPAGDGGVTVTRLKVPFVHLMAFFLKATLAAIPAMLLLGVLLWGFGQGLKHFFPALRHFEIVVKSIQ